MIGQMLWLEFFGNRDWPVASALAVVLLVILVTPIMIYRQREARQLEKWSGRNDRCANKSCGARSTSRRWRSASRSSICRSRSW